jgi:von Willebrand factor type A domain
MLGFIADCSGSMNGLGRIDAVRNALGAAIEALEPDTTFFIVAFDFEARVVFAPARATSSNKRQAHERVAGLHPGGGTAMSTGLEMALRSRQRTSSPATVTRRLSTSSRTLNSCVAQRHSDPSVQLLKPERLAQVGVCSGVQRPILVRFAVRTSAASSTTSTRVATSLRQPTTDATPLRSSGPRPDARGTES